MGVGTWPVTANEVIARGVKDIGMGENPPGSNVNPITLWYGLPGEPWCAQAQVRWFYDASAGHVDLRKLLTPEAASTVALMEAGQRLGLWHNGDGGIGRGDLVFYHFPDGDPGVVNHVGIVTQAATLISSLEGNIGNVVALKTRSRTGTDPKVVGYIRPPYAPPTFQPSAPKPKPSAPPYPGRRAFGVGKRGDYITAMGRRLVAHGYGSHYAVGPGPEWTEADRLNVQDFQHAQGWHDDRLGGASDGYPGPETWARLFR